MGEGSGKRFERKFGRRWVIIRIEKRDYSKTGKVIGIGYRQNKREKDVLTDIHTRGQILTDILTGYL